MNTLTHKGYGRIYVDWNDHIQTVHNIIKEMDEYEFGYMPSDIVTHASDYPKVVYTHKFDDLDMDELTARCWRVGVRIWVFNAGHNEYPTSKMVTETNEAAAKQKADAELETKNAEIKQKATMKARTRERDIL